jgi:hypothetical protein
MSSYLEKPGASGSSDIVGSRPVVDFGACEDDGEQTIFNYLKRFVEGVSLFVNFTCSFGTANFFKDEIMFPLKMFD